MPGELQVYKGALWARTPTEMLEDGVLRAQPVFCLCRRTVLPHLNDYLASGRRKMADWYATLNVVEVVFDDEAAAFENINTRDELGRFGTTPGQ